MGLEPNTSLGVFIQREIEIINGLVILFELYMKMMIFLYLYF